MSSFVNRSFVIMMAAILEVYGLKASNDSRPRPGEPIADVHFALLTRWLRNCFAHSQHEFDPANPKHVETRQLLERLLPAGAAVAPGFPTPIDTVLEPLKDGVLRYIASGGSSAGGPPSSQ